MGFTIRGTIRKKENGQGLSGLTVEAYDADLIWGELLGNAKTDDRGAFAISCPAHAGIGDLPDVYLEVKTGDDRLLRSTRPRTIANVKGDITLDVEVPQDTLIKAGLEQPQISPPRRDRTDQGIHLKEWLWRHDADLDRPLLAEIHRDLDQCGSIVELFKVYKEILDRSGDIDDPVYAKLDVLFQLGCSPEAMTGHFYGVTLGIRKGSRSGTMAEYGNVLGLIWGATLADECPWVGKSLSPIEPDKLKEITGSPAIQGQSAFWGINHFNRIPTRALNPAAFQFLNFWMDLYPAPEDEQRAYNWERNGAHFIGSPASSICAPSPQSVFQLNYRYRPLGNRAPNCWLIDELVEISPGLFLGQLCYATRRLTDDYDPHRPPRDYDYRNFGYFLLLDANWHTEARRLFPHLEIPPDAPGMRQPGVHQNMTDARYSTLTLQSPALPICNDDLFSRVQREVRQYPTLLHYFKACARSLGDNLSNASPYFDQLAELFLRGIAPWTMDGFYNGALVGWRSAALFEIFGINNINLLYTSLGAPFSTWTGKRFDPIPIGRLREITDGYETGQVPTVWGSNTQALRTLKERFVGRLMDLAKIWSEEATLNEKQALGYDLKNFFFIGRPGTSVCEQCGGKQVYQFNYRWPKLKTMVPDCFCIDELVQIAQGLFLGRLMYATNIAEPYHPTKDPRIYRYELFGYFLLMDRQWQQIRLAIGYDLDNV